MDGKLTRLSANKRCTMRDAASKEALAGHGVQFAFSYTKATHSTARHST